MSIFCRNLFFDYFCRGMLGIVMTTTAMCLCAFWSVVLALDLLKYGNRAAHRELLVWCVTSTVLYAGHFFFLTDIRHICLFLILFIVYAIWRFILFISITCWFLPRGVLACRSSFTALEFRSLSVWLWYFYIVICPTQIF